MTSKTPIPKNLHKPNQSKDLKMSSFKDLASKRMKKKVKFMGEDVTIYKLTVKEVLEIQEAAKSLNDENTEEGLSVLRKVISLAVEGADELDESDFERFPMEELSRLSQEVMKYSGMGDKPQGKTS